MKLFQIRLLLALFLGLGLAFNSFGQNEVKCTPAEIEKVNAGIQKMNVSTQSISSQFTQIKNLSFLSEKVESTGLFYFQKENKIRWEYKTPTPYIIVINADRVYIDNNREKKSFDSKTGKGFKMLNKMIVKCMDGSIAEDPDYVINYFKTTEGFKISLIPKSKTIKSFVKEIQMHIDGKDHSVQALKLIESDEGDYTHIQFHHKTFNQKIESTIFSGF